MNPFPYDYTTYTQYTKWTMRIYLPRYFGVFLTIGTLGVCNDRDTRKLWEFIEHVCQCQYQAGRKIYSKPFGRIIINERQQLDSSAQLFV